MNVAEAAEAEAAEVEAAWWRGGERERPTRLRAQAAGQCKNCTCSRTQARQGVHECPFH